MFPLWPVSLQPFVSGRPEAALGKRQLTGIKILLCVASTILCATLLHEAGGFIVVHVHLVEVSVTWRDIDGVYAY